MINKKRVKLPSISECSGCGGCESICHARAITIKENSLGWRYASIDFKRCTACNRCVNVCPVLQHSSQPYGINNIEKTNIFAACAIDPVIRKNCSSGGVFGAIASKIWQQNGMVAGAVISGIRVKHILTGEFDYLPQLSGSKYMHSDTGNIYNETVDALKAGKTVLFCGTPCQVAAVLAIVPETLQEKLYTADIICHGVPGRLLWNLFCDTSKYDVTHINSFRDKMDSWYKSYAMSFTVKDGRIIRLPSSKNTYIAMYSRNFACRPSCNQCKFTGRLRRCDFTLADFWGYNGKLPNPEQGISVAIAHTAKGFDLLAGSELMLEKTTFEAVEKVNKRLYCGEHPAKNHPIHRFLPLWNRIFSRQTMVRLLCRQYNGCWCLFGFKLYDYIVRKIKKK